MPPLLILDGAVQALCAAYNCSVPILLRDRRCTLTLLQRSRKSTGPLTTVLDPPVNTEGMEMDDSRFFFTSEGSAIKYEYSWLHRHCTAAQTHHQRAKGSGQLFSGLLTVNVLFLGAALISSVILSHGSVPAQDFQIFLSVLMLLSSGWMLYHLLYTRKKTHAILLKDHHAGALSVRASLVLFGLFSLLLSIFKIGYDVTLSCKLALEIIFSSVEILFISMQTCLLWISCKDCIQVQHNVARCGIMLTLSTNLLLWFLAVVNDSVHREQESEERNTTSEVNTTCLCPAISLCQTFHRGYVTLYPFNLEFSLVCASMLFIMWKNVGRIQHNPFDSPQSTFRLRGVVYGPLLGVATVLVGVCVFVQYQIQVSVGTAPPASYQLYYAYSITVLPTMIICSAIGIIAHSISKGEGNENKIVRQKNKHNNRDEKKDTTEETSGMRKQDIKENGQMNNVEHKLDHEKRERFTEEEMEKNLQRPVDKGEEILNREYNQEHTEHREIGNDVEKHEDRENEEHKEEHIDSGYCRKNTKQSLKVENTMPVDRWHMQQQSSKNYTRSLEIILLLGAALGQFSISYYSIVAILATDPWNLINSLNLAYSILMIIEHLLQNIFIIECMRGEGGEATHPVTATEESEEEIVPPRRMSIVEMRRVSLAYLKSIRRLSISRRIVKEISLFLVLCNIMFWIMSAFGNHPQYTNGVEREFYGFSAWISILNFGLPLSVFYRMHSVGALLGVYMNT